MNTKIGTKVHAINQYWQDKGLLVAKCGAGQNNAGFTTRTNKAPQLTNEDITCKKCLAKTN